jgi:hypothetical protein
MKATRLYSGSDGESHFEEIELQADADLGPSRRTKLMDADGVYFIDCEGEHNSDWHTAPSPLLFIIMRGELEIETGNGSKRKFGPDSIFIAADTTGRGHLSRTKNRKAIVIRLT